MSQAGLLLQKPFLPLVEDEVARVSGATGVFEIADANGETLYIGWAGGRSLFGMRGELAVWLKVENADQFRTESNQQYMSRWNELMMAHKVVTGAFPGLNQSEETVGLGRLGEYTEETK
tara:strand:- start:6068 stop:6424 length:357 start_codon:yes stop_codon:yes gene_type:complete